MNKNIWKTQLEFEKKFFKYKNLNIDDLSIDEKRFWTKEFFNHITIELSEVLNNLQYKMHRNYEPQINEHNIKEGIIDSVKLILGLTQIWFKDYDEFQKIFFEKSDIVNKRFEFEKLKNISNSKNDIALIDIDGVLADIEYSTMELIRKEFPEFSQYSNTREIKSKFPIEYEKIKHIMRTTEFHRNIKLIDGATKFINNLIDKKYKIVIITARPYKKYNNLWADTLYWLNSNNIKFDALYFDNQKHEKIVNVFKENLSNIKFIVDDKAEICKYFNVLNIKTFNIDHKNVTFNTILEQI